MKKRARFFLSVFIFSILVSHAEAQNFQLRRGGSQTSSAASSSPSENDVKPEQDKKMEETASDAASPSKEEEKDEKKSAEVESAEIEVLNPEKKSEKLVPDFFVTFGPMLMVNTDNTKEGAPSPIMYAGSFGATLKKPSSSVYFEPRLAFFTNYYLWDGEYAQPAEIENRTAMALSFLLDLCGGFSWTGKNLYFSAGGGLGVLARIGILAGGVDDDETNSITGSTAKEDVSSINSDFYKNISFLYPELTFSVSHIVAKSCKAGGEARIYIPLGSLVSGKGLDAMLVSLAFKFNLPEKKKITTD